MAHVLHSSPYRQILKRANGAAVPIALGEMLVELKPSENLAMVLGLWGVFVFSSFTAPASKGYWSRT